MKIGLFIKNGRPGERGGLRAEWSEKHKNFTKISRDGGWDQKIYLRPNCICQRLGNSGLLMNVLV